ncbi:MAG: GNAT family N-acetyltransferase [Siphonobacter sp.]
MGITTFRIASPDDYKKLVIIVNQFDRYLSLEHGKASINNKELARSRRYVKKYLSDSNAAYLIAENENHIVAYAFLSIEKDKPSLGFINELFVDPEERQQGIAKLLINESINWFRNKRAENVQLTVHRTNKRAIQLYLASNFQPYESEYIEMRLPVSSS